MMKATKSASMLLMLALSSTLVLSACGNSEPDKTEEPVSTTDKTETTATDTNKESEPAKSDLKEYKLTMVYPGGTQQDEAKIEDEINKYLKDKINATIDLQPIDWTAWEDKVNLMIASRDPVDIYFTAQWTKYAVNVGKGAFLDLGPLLKDYGQDIVKTLDPVFLEGSKINGVNYGVPTNKELAAQGGIVYRKDIADELSIDMSKVKSIQDLDAVFATVKAKKPEMTPLYLLKGENFDAHYFGNFDALGDTSVPGILLKDATDTTIKANYDTQRYVDTLKLTRDFFVKGYINSDAATTTTMNKDALKAGNVFAMTAALKPGKAKELETELGLVGKLGQIELNEKTVSTSETSGSMLAISTTSGDPARAMMFINLLHSDKYLNNLINFGIEGQHYTKNGEIITPTDNTKNYAPGAAWMFGNQFLNYVWNSEDPDKWEQFRKFNEGPKVSPGLGFVFDSEKVKAEVGAIVNIDRQYQTALETGSVDVDKVLPEYKDKLLKAGVDKILIEKQAQFDKYISEKK
ncbi:extracellular solute-binding protein family 1 [Paenibacillus curdlanolyticus YK9]|uniref:Extracellular solute-binding protein family 1 n=1 Tax=Paenibacillus curdlanolyticus YK9 TaxID=717606 RepID=E0I6Y9_9BACL|nr:ABC transporter substrate-binding protein [Paenibacillus curdlanolyticus]EFM11805.1 extracellular solute-binding protein family 1 [Paenibacillus curdlanolyticus YK9]